VLGALAVSGVWIAIATRKSLDARRLRLASGREALMGRCGVVRRWQNGDGQVFVDGALWRARPSWPDSDERLKAGDRIVVERVSGLTLAVRRAEHHSDDHRGAAAGGRERERGTRCERDAAGHSQHASGHVRLSHQEGDSDHRQHHTDLDHLATSDGSPHSLRGAEIWRFIATVPHACARPTETASPGAI
jgi:hypothetical protein